MLTNAWFPVSTTTPHYAGESNFNSTTVHCERAIWIQKEVHIFFTPNGQRFEVEGKSNQTTNHQPDTPISTNDPFWYGGHMYRFIPTNMPATLTILPFRYRQDVVRPPQPPLPK